MSIRSFNHSNLQNYPKIQINRGSVIKPCVADVKIATADQFLDGPNKTWRKFLHDIWIEGFPLIMRWISNLHVSNDANIYYIYLIKVIKYIALLMTHIHGVYLYIYGYFYPYSLLSLDQVCDEFSRCPKWTESVIRSFAWHSNHDRCALAVCNDYVYVYQGASRIKVLRHNLQRKIVDMAWQPTNKEVLAVATQTHIFLWRVTDCHEANHLRESSKNLNLTYLAPGLHLVQREKVTKLNGILKNGRSCVQSTEINTSAQQLSNENYKILDNLLPAPIISLQFDKSGDRLYACSPNSSKIAVINVTSILNSKNVNEKISKHVEYKRQFGLGITKLAWSPNRNRLAAATTSSFFKVFEPFKWTSNRWPTYYGLLQDMVWSKPTGRMLLIANKNEPLVYALPFLDSPQAKDVGGNKSLVKALDLTATISEFGDTIGGRVQSFAWDINGRRLAISFKDNPESILLYKTIEKPTLEFHQMGVLKSDNCSYPLLMDFHDKYKNGSLLTICWSDGNCQHIPLSHNAQEFSRANSSYQDGFNNSSMERSKNGLSMMKTPPRTPRSLTNFCRVSGNNSISSFSNSLMPINKVQHQTTLYSLSSRSPSDENISDLSNK